MSQDGQAAVTLGRFQASVGSDTLGVSRFNLVEHLARRGKPRVSYRHQRNDALLLAIRQLTDGCLTYGYGRIMALLDRARLSQGWKPSSTSGCFA